MKIIILADDSKKELAVRFCIAYYGILKDHEITATGSMAKRIDLEVNLDINRLLSGPQGGYEQVISRIAYGEVDLVIYFRDGGSKETIKILDRCDAAIVPYATNLASAELMVNELKGGNFMYKEQKVGDAKDGQR